MTFTPEVRERLERDARLIGGTFSPDLACALSHIDALEARRNELVASLSTLDAWEKIKLLERAEQAEEREAALEARVAVLAPECRAWRAADANEDGPMSIADDAVMAAMAATDAAGALEGGKP